MYIEHQTNQRSTERVQSGTAGEITGSRYVALRVTSPQKNRQMTADVNFIPRRTKQVSYQRGTAGGSGSSLWRRLSKREENVSNVNLSRRLAHNSAQIANAFGIDCFLKTSGMACLGAKRKFVSKRYRGYTRRKRFNVENIMPVQYI
jgi:hypothetical protein